MASDAPAFPRRRPIRIGIQPDDQLAKPLYVNAASAEGGAAGPGLGSHPFSPPFRFPKRYSQGRSKWTNFVSAAKAKACRGRIGSGRQEPGIRSETLSIQRRIPTPAGSRAPATRRRRGCGRTPLGLAAAMEQVAPDEEFRAFLPECAVAPCIGVSGACGHLDLDGQRPTADLDYKVDLEICRRVPIQHLRGRDLAVPPVGGHRSSEFKQSEPRRHGRQQELGPEPGAPSPRRSRRVRGQRLT